MSTEAAATVGFYRFLSWLETNRNKVIQYAVIIAVVATVAGYFIWSNQQQETLASAALSNVSGQDSADAYLKVAEQYPKTAAAPRAVLFAAGELFSLGKYDDAQKQFARITESYPDSQFRVQALMGIAACLDAAGKSADAAPRYDNIIKTFPADPAVPSAKSALARIYETQNKPELALPIYEDLLRAQGNTSYGLEAGIRRLDLLAKHPELAKAAPTASVSIPAK